MIALFAQWRLIGAAGAVAAIMSLMALWRIEAGRAHQLDLALAAARAAQAGAEAKAAASDAAAQVIAKGAERDARSAQQHMENAHALEFAQGADQRLDPALNAAGRLGLCGYRAYDADPACLQLRGADPRQPAPAGGGDRPAVP